MSIFKSSFSPSVQGQLKVRQDAMTNRTAKNLQYLNSRNAWIRMSSSVNVDGKNDLAKKYILQGGTLNVDPQSTNLNDASKKQGIGTFNNAYSNVSQTGTKYRLGIRPMPGITGIEVKSLSAYGSLREVTVNFQCWDIQQLEDLEVLYMRPGYTVLVEWGWTPYLLTDPKDNSKTIYESNFTDYYDIINSPSQNRTKLFKDLYNKSIQYGGNYDAMFGYVKNYQWSARMDGGYDCQTNIISTGEIIESLKINYISPIDIKQQQSNIVVPYAAPTPPTSSQATFNNPNVFRSITNPLSQPVQNVGLLQEEFTNPGKSIEEWEGAYQTNILAGVWAELYYKSADPISKASAQYTSPNSALYKEDVRSFDSLSLFSPENNKNSLSAKTSRQIYVTLGGIVNILNKYIIAKSSADGQPLVRLSLQANEYDQSPTMGSDLLCTAHPLQVSVDPSVCLIKSPLWAGGEIINITTASAVGDIDLQIANTALDLVKKGYRNNSKFYYGTDISSLVAGFKLITTKEIYIAFVNLLANNSDKKYNTIDKVLNEELGKDDLNTATIIKSQLESIKGVTLTFNTEQYKREPYGSYLVEDTFKLTSTIDTTSSSSTISSKATIVTKSPQAIADLQFLKSLTADYFYQGKPELEIGVIRNIYINVDYLFQKAIDTGLEAGDSKEKNEINLYSYLKKLILDIQTAIGNVSSFEIHVDPVDNNVARIIDVNYTEPDKATYDKLFPLEVHNLKSIVRSYSLQSQIFPNQSAIIAIGSQAKGGQLGMQTNTMIDFNKNLVDRIIPGKLDGLLNPSPSQQNGATTITNGLAQIINAFYYLNASTSKSSDTTKSKVDSNALFLQAKNSLRDVIAYFQSFTKSPGSNRNLIPTKFSCEIDGIGGLVIGHMFKLPDDIMPKGYRGEGVGSRLGNAITSIGHTISNGDWVTKIDTLNIVLDPSNPTDVDFGSLDLTAIKTVINTAITTGTPLASTPSTSGGNANWMKQAGNAVFNNNGGEDSYCAKYTYAIARGYTMASRGNTPDGRLGVNGKGVNYGVGNAETETYRLYLESLGYKMSGPVTLTRQQLIDKINGTWAIGDIINYRSITPTPTKPSAYQHGHTQIYTGNSLDVGGRGGGGSNNTPWASSWANNYGLSFVYNRTDSDSWEVYVFKIQ